jgi:glycerol uptake facilitator protein
MRRLLGACASEFLGTFVLVFFGVGSVTAAVATGAQQGLWQVAVVWALGVSLAIYATAAVSGAHINPAISLAMTLWRGFPLRRLVPYWLAQLAGAFSASLLLYLLFHNLIAAFEGAHGLVRGAPGSELSAMMFGEYFPNPGIIGAGPQHWACVTPWQACLAEAVGTAFLAGFVFALTERRNEISPGALTPLFIGLAVAAIISIIAPLTQAGLNPARDFGPRLVALLFGWGSIALPGPRGGFFTVYILAPMVGAVIGAAIYQLLIRSFLPGGGELAVKSPASEARP